MTRFYIPLLIILIVTLQMGCSGNTPVQETGLAAHWTFDELTGNNGVTPDVSGNGHDGTINGQQLVEGIIGKAMKFEGLDQIVETGDVGVSAPASFAFWFKTDDLFRDRRLFSQIEGAENQAGALRLDGVQIEIWDGAEWHVLIDRQMKIKQWMHIAVVFEADGKTSGYLNGDRQHLARSGCDFKGVKTAIGAKFLNETGNPYTGCLDDFRIYSRALSGEEVKTLYTAATR